MPASVPPDSLAGASLAPEPSDEFSEADELVVVELVVERLRTRSTVASFGGVICGVLFGFATETVVVPPQALMPRPLRASIIATAPACSRCFGSLALSPLATS